MKKNFPVKKLVLAALFSALIAVGAFIKIPVGIVPVTLQMFFVLLAGLLLGPKAGFLSAAAYIFIGLTGIPVFTKGGGPGYVLEPTFGYLLGFALGALASGLVVNRFKKKTFLAYALGGLAGIAAVYLIGVPYFYLISDLYLGASVDIKNMLVYCWLIFIPSDTLSLLLAAFLAKRLNKVIS